VHDLADEVMEMLLAKDTEGRIPFHYACIHSPSSLDTLQSLLAQEAKLNDRRPYVANNRSYQRVVAIMLLC
jgi:ankyrin repeat protein